MKFSTQTQTGPTWQKNIEIPNSLSARMFTRVQQLQPYRQVMKTSLVFPNPFGVKLKGLKTNYIEHTYVYKYISYI